ncbi:hypothetical protein [Clostridium uliginosum]|uniref:Uncharacterized protein n=1 Tax=Clostridium uliginosum TaxID=119641 RepID=A0A1I1NYK1_9CLOT|nr:hypothetical protein [Clostridium uliginosum]SFD02412.1 hypothetical protein SAMN05421842_11746 [Clostridium uliginosum]
MKNNNNLKLPFFIGRLINKTPIIFTSLAMLIFGFCCYLLAESFLYSILLALAVMVFNILVYYPLYLNNFFNYWILNEDKIIYVNSNNYKNSLKRFLKGLSGKEKDFEKVVYYENIKEVSVLYKKKIMDVSNILTLTAYAPVAYMPYLRDPFYIKVITKEDKEIQLDLSLDYFKNKENSYLKLNQIFNFLIDKNIKVKDSKGIIEASKNNESVIRHIYS